LARLFTHEGNAKFVNGVLRGLLRKKDSFTFPDKEKEATDYISLEMYHPRWLVKKWLKNYGRAETEALCAFDNTPAPVCLRVNTLVTTRDELMAKLTAAGGEVRASKWSADGIVCDRLPALSTVFADMHNEFYVQDESSMLVGPVLAPKAGDTVVDMCSAPGGKTTHLAQLMQNEGIIYAGDVHEHKIKLIEENATRLGIKIINAQIQDATEFVEAWEGKADKVLVDAPCSGMGVLRRRAEARWRKTRNDLKIFPPLQLKILTNAARYVKAGGTLVYSTCTIEQAENHYLVQEFLAAHPDWSIEPFAHPLTGEMVDELQLMPNVDNVDGFYICKLRKK
jgi:16S rRNA (cytosine967-C5)-methyltransferase